MFYLLRRLSSTPFLRNTSFYFIGNLISKAFVFITIPIFTRLLTPDQYGLVTIYLSLSSIFFILIPLNLQTSIRQKYLKDTSDYAVFLGTLQITFLFLFIIKLTVFHFLREIICDFFKISSTIYWYAFVTAIIMVINETYLRYLLAKNESKSYSIVNILKGAMELAFSIGLIYVFQSEKYLGRINGHILGFLIISLYCFYKIYNLSSYKFRLDHLKFSILFSVPLIPHFISQFVLGQFDRLIINQLIGQYETGLYAVAYNVGSILQIIVMSSNNAWIPEFYGLLKKNMYQTLKYKLYSYTKIILFIALCLTFFSKEILFLLADPKYFDALEIVPIIFLSGLLLFYYTVYANYSFYEGKTLYISIGTLFAGSVNVVLNYWLIPKYGYIIAAYTTLTSYLLLLILHYLNAKFVVKQSVLPMLFVAKQMVLFLIFFIIGIYLNSKFSYGVLVIIMKLFLIIGYYAFFLKLKIKKIR